MKKTIVFALFALLASLQMYSQMHLAPENGENGIPDAVANSFVMLWASVEGAVDYEYVLSNNRACFESCPGDTRQHRTGGDTTASEHNLIADRWYYWITRVIYDDGSYSEWTSISTFYTKTPQKTNRLVAVAPNPVKEKTLNLIVDWAETPNARGLYLQVYGLDGNVATDIFQFERGVGRFQQISQPLFFLKAGTYVLHFVIDDLQAEKDKQFNLKVIFH